MRQPTFALRRVALACAWLAAAHAATPALAAAAESSSNANAPENTPATSLHNTLGIVVVEGASPSSLPTTIPTTIEGITAAEIEKSVNATDAEDALKYMPSLLVRKRYVGDYNHAVLSTRASGTGNSARSLVFADGIQLSNLLGNGATFAPRWGLVTPEEIERVDVLYGPFSAAYPGNSVGAVVDYQTRMPKSFEAHAKVGLFSQPFHLYGTDKTYGGHQESASLGNRQGDWSWWVNVNHLDSDGQPLTFVTKSLSTTAAAASAPVLTGAVSGTDKNNSPWLIIGAGTQYRSKQDHAKLKLTYDFSPTLRASYTFGWWHNSSVNQSQSYLSDSSGNPFYSLAANSGTTTASTINIGGKAYSVAATDFGRGLDRLEHQIHGLSLKSNTRGEFDYELDASLYDYSKDISRSALTARPGADAGGAGRITDLGGTGWHTLAAKGVWRPKGSAHVVDVGLQQEDYNYKQITSNTADWISGAPSSLFTAFKGKTQLQSAYAQDAWGLSPQLKTVLGLRLEQWQAREGSKTAADGSTVGFADRKEHYVSPKAAVGYELSDAWSLKLSTGRAVRMPTVGELYQGGVSSAGVYVANDPITNPDLKPEKSWTSELGLSWAHGDNQVRSTLFYENTHDALYSQTYINSENKSVSSTQNIGRMRTQGVEFSLLSNDAFTKGLDLQASLTYADSKIMENSGFVSVAGDTIGRQQPRVPKWRATVLASYQISPALSASYGMRYSGKQYGTLNNSDPNGFAYQGFSKFFTTDVRVLYRISKQWSLAGGIDNLNNYQYWNFHPFPQRSYSAELKFDL